jgi:hypothetical protein
MLDFLKDHISEIISAIGGAFAGSLITLRLTRNQVKGSGSVVDQSRATAGGDITGGDKNTGRDIRR